ncbi:hypothetical protein HPB52_014029 [Rhipicephalus sanguineus]|uniref:Regulatory protein zeste n=1 Tax=Rhipicephalus sanguineus TaxID=34632 RepID=A0A9D4PWB1_RHISA|nr:hypothetical protein HPB52_014029 [Rhipicephalus sanguineus]
MGAARKAALWAEVSDALNALGPAVKAVRHWRKYWSRLCCDSRKLARDVERERRRTGGGRLGGVEGRVLAILDRTGPDSDPIRLFTGDDEHGCSPIHPARSVTKVLEEHVIPTNDWPPVGADVNPIENILGIMNTLLATLNLGSTTADALWTALNAEWKGLRSSHRVVQTLYDSIPRRIQLVSAAEGNMMTY